LLTFSVGRPRLGLAGMATRREGWCYQFRHPRKGASCDADRAPPQGKRVPRCYSTSSTMARSVMHQTWQQGLTKLSMRCSCSQSSGCCGRHQRTLTNVCFSIVAAPGRSSRSRLELVCKNWLLHGDRLYSRRRSRLRATQRRVVLRMVLTSIGIDYFRHALRYRNWQPTYDPFGVPGSKAPTVTCAFGTGRLVTWSTRRSSTKKS
jgi:hypothetical protein